MSASRSPDTATPVGRTMHAIVHRQYGTPDRLTFEEVARPLRRVGEGHTQGQRVIQIAEGAA